MPDGSSTAHLYKPKLASTFVEGYGVGAFRKDVLAALTVAIVALPLSMAIAVASGVTPDRGLYAAIVGGFLVSALGGSRFQIGGPAGAFIVLVAATVAKVGIDGLLTTVLLSGVLLTVLGLSRIGSLIRHVPHGVVVGFTCGIAIIILASQLKDLAGLTPNVPEPGPLLPKLAALAVAGPTFRAPALLMGIGCAILIFALGRWRPAWPALLIAVVATSVATFVLDLPVETIGTRFGGIPHGLNWPQLPDLSVRMILNVLPEVLAFTLLGGIESLLSAKVADGMTGRRHRSNMELVAQGVANVASAVFGGISVTGTIARTATNVRAGANSPVAGMLHALFLLLFMLFAAPLASFIPLSALAGVLIVVSINMFDGREFAKLLSGWRTGAVLLTTFGLTLFIDLTFGIVGGCVVAALLATLAKRGRRQRRLRG